MSCPPLLSCSAWISSKHKDEPDESDGSANINGANADKNKVIEQSLDFEQFETCYCQLKMELRLCLLCFSVFPENVEIKKRVMIYSWMREGFVHPVGRRQSSFTPEQFANEFFNKLIAKGFIEPVCKNSRLGVDICKMHHVVRSMVIKLAKRTDFFDFDEAGTAKETLQEKGDLVAFC
ncbi:disease resistance RPP13-like protein 4 [Camellia sinensis]|uniref:disease resistance RPP13-like protein 4 n=1 Tax=Camellia sinensis TaxID=4442 RepID=UPI0010360F41|nr:disease resistance RPP13-like protein 4 [Camellia sinensis]